MNLESGSLGDLKLDTIRAFVDALGARMSLTLNSGAGDPRLLVDAGHAFIQEHLKRRLERWGWLVRAEVSFNHYGDRGRIDLLAYFASLRILLVIEIKTVLWDMQALLGALDVKLRVAPLVAREQDWHPRIVIPMIVLAAGTTVRRRLAEHASLFARFDLAVGRRFPGFVVLSQGRTACFSSPTCQMPRWATVDGLDDDACGWRELSRARLQAIRPCSCLTSATATFGALGAGGSA